MNEGARLDTLYSRDGKKAAKFRKEQRFAETGAIPGSMTENRGKTLCQRHVRLES
jgi:hypothetical protein